MRRSKGSTPASKTKRDSDVGVQGDKESGKKLVQARLPFKIIAPMPSASGSKEKPPIESFGGELSSRKRKLNYDSEKSDEGEINEANSKENVITSVKKVKTAEEENNIVVELSDDDDDGNDGSESFNKGNGDEKETLRTPNTRSGRKRKDAKTTPGIDKQRKGKGDAIKPQIKLPLRSGKLHKLNVSLKDRKSIDDVAEDDSDLYDTSTDEMEVISRVLNPQKRKRIEAKEKEEIEGDKPNDGNELSANTVEMIPDDGKSNDEKYQDDEDIEIIEIREDTETHDKSCSDVAPSPQTVGSSSTDADDSTIATPSVAVCAPSKILTPKQMKLMEQRRLAREEKERKLQEERKQKQREKEERELSKKREREEREEQKRKDREEKEDQKRKEREEKERKRLAEIETKNEEKRKRIEAKEEELRKRENEKKRRELEKEEVELKKRKAAEAFTKFFVPKTSGLKKCVEQDDVELECKDDGDQQTLAFRPFQIRADMKLAPIGRKTLSPEEQKILDSFVCNQNVDETSQPRTLAELYLSHLKTGKVAPVKWKRTAESRKDGPDDDIQIIEDEFDRAGLAIVEEVHPPLECHRAKFLKFRENRRPAYYGTWRKKSDFITPRRPFAQDKKYFDYEVDSDDEWEEEEPGESLDGSDDEKDKESEDDDYEVDNEWFVPHGHLSDEEIQNEDEMGNKIGEMDNNTREAQKAKLQLLQQEFALEMKKKTEKLKPRLIGCIWNDENGNQPDHCPNIIWQTISEYAMMCADVIVVEPPEPLERNEPGSPSINSGEKPPTEKLKPIVITEDMLKVLVRLVHGNSNSKAFLIKEFIAYVEANEDAIRNGDVRGPLKSMVREKIDEFAEWKVTETTARSKKQNKIKKHLCWIVSEEVLNRMDLQELSLHNKWQYILTPKSIALASDSVPTAQSEPHPKSDGTQAMATMTAAAVDENAQSSEINDGSHKTVSATKKRVPLLMSVERGQPINTPAKNALISQFLKNSAEEKAKIATPAMAMATEPIELD